VRNWNPDSVEVPPAVFASLCRFDFSSPLERANAKAYREAELPFIMYNHPKMQETVAKWSDVAYLGHQLGKRKYLIESSKNNHFMYFSGRNGPAGWVPPVTETRMGWHEWLAFATTNANATSESPHLYFRTSSKEASTPDSTTRQFCEFERATADLLPFRHTFYPANADPLPLPQVRFLEEDLSMLTPAGDAANDFIVDRKGSRGIFCRFGMHGINAAAHFDGSRNVVAVMGGLRR